MQGFTRLDDPQTVAGDANEEGSVNLIRQKVLALQHMLRLAREGVHRHCRLVSETRPPELEAATGNLLTWLNTAFRAVAKARTREAASQAEDTEEIGRERKLADEFISMRFIAFIADSQAMVDGMLGAPAASDGRFRPTLALK